ncbi:hypothetical protein SLE2022_079460 [Rubroshorea leprosula]
MQSPNSSIGEETSRLSVCDSVSDEEFEERFQELRFYGDVHLICVIEDDQSGEIVATGSVFVEKKFLRNWGKVGHIEDVVVDAVFYEKCGLKQKEIQMVKYFI